ncbi:flagellar filament capping protein FliD [Modicisalibacter xianhensis]|uniref:Flagellar hook-associated protein 2 n=1 Tax=Modicisalibacter xianhensis TaxID=442341 RepID=A0A1I3A375_9GAMM|nr:flagellar filament capping protein FliD [Halomonas xianhensis]SFH44612.1 flagellar hook-associated protein 2 [Halomonas xianhensis]
MASIASLGIGTGLDLNGLLNQLQSAERQKLTPIVQQQKSYQAKISAYGKLESALTEFQEATKKLNKADTFQAVTSSVTGDGVTAAAGTDAVPGSYTVNVAKLAKAQSLATGGVADKTAQIGTGAGTISITQNGTTHNISVADGASSLEDIRDAINGEGIGVTASIVNVGGDKPHRLVLSSKETGTTSTMEISSTDNTALDDLLHHSTTSSRLTETVAAQDAELTVNGLAITSQSNQLEEAIQGVTLNLVSEGSTSTINVVQDSETITADVQAFVDSYNSLQKTLDTLTAYNAASDSAGTLLGDSTTRSIDNRLRSAMSDSLGTGTLQRLSDIGIDLKLDGSLELDADKLNGLLASSPASLSQFFSGDEVTDGFADKLDAVMEPMLKSDGILDTATSGLEKSIDSLGERYDRVESSINATIERYRKQFAAMDSLVAQMNSTTSYLSQQFEAMNAQLGQ